MPRADFDYTMLSTYCSCPRKYDYRINRGLVPKVEFKAPEFGKAIHMALDSLYKDWDREKAIEVFRANFVEDPMEDKRTYKMGEWILENYATKYQDQPWKVLSTEQSFCVPLPNGNNFIGRIDKIIDWNGTLWVVDHKTTSQLGSQYPKMAEPNGQFTGYIYAAKKLGYNVQGIILDAILVAKGLLDSKYRDKLTPLLRYDSYRSDKQVAEWLYLTQQVQDDIREDEETSSWIPYGQLTGACTYYGECTYRKLCVEEIDIRDRIINQDYQVSMWDPRHEEVK